MADMEKEERNESMDDSMFSMYSEWIENGNVAEEAEYEPGTSTSPIRETVAAEKHLQLLDYAQGDTVGSLGAKCEKLRQQIRGVSAEMRIAAMKEFERRYPKAKIDDNWQDEKNGADADLEFDVLNFYVMENYYVNLEQFFPADSVKEKDRLTKELAEAEERLQVLNEAQEADFLKSKGETIPKSEKKQEKLRNPFEELVRIVEQKAPEEAAALKEVQQYMEEMDNDLKSMRRELDDLKRQLTERSDSSDLGKQAVKNLEKNVNGLETHNKGFKNYIFQKAAQVINNFKARGDIALCNIVQKLGIKESLMEDRKYYLDNVEKMQKSIDKLDAINAEFQAAKSHFKNIGRLTIGKEALQPPQDKENFIIKMLKVPYTHYRDRYQKMAYKAGKRIARLEKLEQKAVQARSTLGKLSDYKKEASAREAEKKDTPGRENVRKEPEMAI